MKTKGVNMNSFLVEASILKKGSLQWVIYAETIEGAIVKFYEKCPYPVTKVLSLNIELTDLGKN